MGANGGFTHVKKRTKKRDPIVNNNKITCTHLEQSYTHTADNLVDSPTIHTVINRLINHGTVVSCSLVINADIMKL